MWQAESNAERQQSRLKYLAETLGSSQACGPDVDSELTCRRFCSHQETPSLGAGVRQRASASRWASATMQFLRQDVHNKEVDTGNIS